MFNIALYQPDIPQNTAAIIRLCACFGTTLEIIEPCGFQLNDKRLKKVAMDYLNKSKIKTYSSYENFLIKKKDSRIILMTTKAKTLLKVGIPLVIVIQLISITFLLGKISRDKAFSCKTAREYLVCRQIELP